jgi:hypothetical protein
MLSLSDALHLIALRCVRNSYRTTSEELRHIERLQWADMYEEVRLASEVHRQTRKYAQSIIKPGIKLIDLCDQLEAMNRKLIEENGLKAGIAFPTGCRYEPKCSTTHSLTHSLTLPVVSTTLLPITPRIPVMTRFSNTAM